tara:strand:+ start:1017 stop:1832 length:816 start_codon:yes stop_codon:yes gene_type:complete
MSEKQKIHFITYGDSIKYLLSIKHIKNLANRSGIFETIKSYSKKDIDQTFLKKYKDVIDQSRGGGFYLWKPWIILNTLNYIDENDIIYYSDAGSSFNPYGVERFKEYINLLNSSEFGNLRFENKKIYIEKHWTTKEILKYFNEDLNSKISNTPQLLGGHLLFKKNDHTKFFFEKFFEVINHDFNLITDFYNLDQIEGFVENRHDQSILSIISKKYGGVILENETFFENNPENQYEYPILSVRNYGHGLRDYIKYYLNIDNKKNKPIFFEEK